MRSLILILLWAGATGVHATEWRKVGTYSWKKEAGEATLTITKLGKATYFFATFPCGTEDRRQTYRWMVGETVGKPDQPCETIVPTGVLMELFTPLPKDYSPAHEHYSGGTAL